MARKAHAAHLCPRCGQHTSAKCYCPPCLAVLRKPPTAHRSSLAPHRWERNNDGKRMRI